MRKTFAPFGEEVTVCSIDLRVGGDYHFVMVTKYDGLLANFDHEEALLRSLLSDSGS